MKSTLCRHLDPVDVAGSLRTDPTGGLIKEQRCRSCGAIRCGVKPRWAHHKTSNGSAWAPWAFDDWGPAMPSPQHPLEEWATGMVEESRRAGRQPGLGVRRPCAAEVLENRELALSLRQDADSHSRIRARRTGT